MFFNVKNLSLPFLSEYSSSKDWFALGIFGGFGTLGAGVFALILPVLLQSGNTASIPPHSLLFPIALP
ncbi:hypothetical protein D0T57_15570 [Dysgonomonas sp. 511]|nr:hypothetical protein [Dysgonomonas sp. 511]